MNTKIEELREKIENCKSEKFLPCYVKYDLVESLIQAYEKEISSLKQQVQEREESINELLTQPLVEKIRELRKQLSNSVSKKKIIHVIDRLQDRFYDFDYKEGKSSISAFKEDLKAQLSLSKSEVKK